MLHSRRIWRHACDHHRKIATSAASCIEGSQDVTSNTGQHLLLSSNSRCLKGLTLRESESAHTHLLKCGVLDSDIYARNNLIEVYSECGHPDYASKLFDEIPFWDSEVWNSAASAGVQRFEKCADSGAKYDQFLPLSSLGFLRSLTLLETKSVHAYLLKSGILYSEISTRSKLVEAYSEHGRMDYTLMIFKEIPSFNSVTWNLILSGCNKRFLFYDCWRVFVEMHRKGVDMDEFTYGSVLSTCCALARALYGEQVYGFVLKNGFFSDGYVRSGMIDLFSRCSRIHDCIRVLHDIECANVVCWNSVVSGAVRSNNNWVALEVFSQMHCHESLVPNAFTFSSVFTACAALKKLELGDSVHGLVIKSGDGADIFVGTTIVNFYAKCGSIDDALKQFRLMPERNTVSWSAIISGFSQKGDSASAVLILKEMQSLRVDINKFTVSSALAACAHPYMVGEALQIHCWSLKKGLDLDPVVKASLINAYSKAGRIDLSETSFAEAHNLEQSCIWSTMISAFVDSEHYDKAAIYFKRMLKNDVTPDTFGASVVLSVIECLCFGTQVHGYILKAGLASDVSVGSSICMMYSKCDDLGSSLKAFEVLENKDYISWTSMIAGFVEHGLGKEAIDLFKEMRFEAFIPDQKLLSAVLNACSVLESLKLGREMHAFTLRIGYAQHFITDEALVNMYSKCADLDSARIVFHMMPFKSQVARSSLISGLTKIGFINEAMALIMDMLRSDTKIDAYSISSIISALAISGESRIGNQLHGHVIKAGLESESFLGSSLVTMYSNCGNISECHRVFQKIIAPDVAAWTAMIISYGNHGKVSNALESFELMKKSGMVPDAATFVGILSACSHSGLVEEGLFHLNSMITEYGIEPGYKHYICMVDLLGRAGRLEEAKNLILNKPLEPIPLEWATLLAACRVHGHNELGKLAADKLLELQPEDAGAYVSASNISAKAGDWDDVLRIRDSMKKQGVNKLQPGWSCV